MSVSSEPRPARTALSPAARALRLQRIFARLQEGASYKDIAAEENISRERLRQIVRAATARGRAAPDHNRMQFARLEPALKLAARGVADGDVKAIPMLLKLLDRLDRYCDPGFVGPPPLLGALIAPRRPRKARTARRPPEPLQTPLADDRAPENRAPEKPAEAEPWRPWTFP